MTADEIQERLVSILKRLTPLRSEAMDAPLKGYDWAAADKLFNALQAEVIETITASPDPMIRGCVGRFVTLRRWMPFEPTSGGLIMGSTASQTKPAAQKHQVGEMCAKLDQDITEFLRDDLPEALQNSPREMKKRGAAADAFKAAFPDGIQPGTTNKAVCAAVRDKLAPGLVLSDHTIERAAGLR